MRLALLLLVVACVTPDAAFQRQAEGHARTCLRAVHTGDRIGRRVCIEKSRLECVEHGDAPTCVTDRFEEIAGDEP